MYITTKKAQKHGLDLDLYEPNAYYLDIHLRDAIPLDFLWRNLTFNTMLLVTRALPKKEKWRRKLYFSSILYMLAQLKKDKNQSLLILAKMLIGHCLCPVYSKDQMTSLVLEHLNQICILDQKDAAKAACAIVLGDTFLAYCDHMSDQEFPDYILKCKEFDDLIEGNNKEHQVVYYSLTSWLFESRNTHPSKFELEVKKQAFMRSVKSMFVGHLMTESFEHFQEIFNECIIA